ncbi:isocitrate/isopropylmalate dehydrogenase family protein [Oceanobacillus jeddahense]|uniref:isocitrate/isopropylmalate dehydrogenase family protein n=1 Tax=Oceanobacillus jeddahense TaxID=1462527 RepID=UPI0005959E9B|nr:isocitrate/isopropylmalate dehydrogenase family protein [Oceanobacillus jeddahense]
MTEYTLGVLKGDGIGPEIVNATISVIEAAAREVDLNLKLKELSIGWEAIEKYEDPIPQVTKDSLEETHGWILGPHDSAAYPDRFKQKRNPSGELRHYFDLYANIRPAKTMPATKSVVGEADLVIYRENTEGFYTDRNMYAGIGEFQITSDVAVSTGVFTRKAIERIAHAAFQGALERKKKVTIVHKANVIKLGTGLFLNTCLEVAKQYPDVEVDDYHIDAMTAHLVRRAGDFDVIVTENMFGDILSDLTGELVGSLGIAPSINSNDTQAMAQAAHGSAPDIAGKNIANPVGILDSTIMLFKWLYTQHEDVKWKDASQLMEKALIETLAAGISTRDLGGQSSTEEFAQAVKERIVKSEK